MSKFSKIVYVNKMRNETIEGNNFSILLFQILESNLSFREHDECGENFNMDFVFSRCMRVPHSEGARWRWLEAYTYQWWRYPRWNLSYARTGIFPSYSLPNSPKLIYESKIPLHSRLHCVIKFHYQLRLSHLPNSTNFDNCLIVSFLRHKLHKNRKFRSI